MQKEIICSQSSKIHVYVLAMSMPPLETRSYMETLGSKQGWADKMGVGAGLL